MLKSVLEAVADGRSVFDLAVVAASFPVAREVGGWLDGRGGAGIASGETLAAALVLGAALLAGVRLGRRVAVEAAPAAGAPSADPAAPPIAARDPGVEASTVARAVAGAPPSPERPDAREGAAEPARVLEDLRTCMDEVSYTPGSPNVLSMTKYVHAAEEEAATPVAPASRAERAGEAAPGVSVRRRNLGAETVLEIGGILDALAVPQVRPAFDALVAQRRTSVTVDLSSLRLVDSSGVGLVVSLFKRCRSFGGDVRVSGLTGQPLAIFRLLRLDRIFAVP